MSSPVVARSALSAVALLPQVDAAESAPVVLQLRQTQRWVAPPRSAVRSIELGTGQPPQ
jgi:hypothetical protein